MNSLIRSCGEAQKPNLKRGKKGDKRRLHWIPFLLRFEKGVRFNYLGIDVVVVKILMTSNMVGVWSEQ